MAAHPVLFGVLAFGLGIVLQGLLMLQGRFLPGDWKRVGLTLLIAFVGMSPGRHERDYSPLQHLFFSLTLAAALFALNFRARLVPRIGGRLLLAWNLLLVFVIAHAGGGTLVLLILIAIPTLLTLLNAFTDIDRDFGWQVFFLAWFSTILAIIALVGFDMGRLGMFFERHGPITTRPPAEMLVAGAAWLYIVSNAWFVVAMVPIPWYRSQSWIERRAEVRRHMKLLAYGYVWEKDDPVRSFAVLFGIPLALLACARWAPGSGAALVPLAIALMPLFGAASSDGRHDGVGELPSDDLDEEDLRAGSAATMRRKRRREASGQTTRS